MSQKFSIVIEIKNGKPVTSTFGRSEAQDAKDCFAKARDAGSEAYLFLQPTEDKRSKSTEQNAASVSPVEPVTEEKKISEYVSKAKSAFKKKEDKADDLSV